MTLRDYVALTLVIAVAIQAILLWRTSKRLDKADFKDFEKKVDEALQEVRSTRQRIDKILLDLQCLGNYLESENEESENDGTEASGGDETRSS